jgi:hypothetical protein
VNVFEAYGEHTKPRHEIRRERIAAKRKSRREIAALQERARREKAYRDETAKTYGELTAEAHALLVDLEQITASGNGRAFLDRLKKEPQLLHSGKALLGVVARLITAKRVAAGLPPFDDPIFDQPPRLFQHVKALLDPEEA